MTFFNTQTGKDIGFFLPFETDDKEKFLFMQEQARKCVDNKHKEEPVRHGHWIEHSNELNKYCSECKKINGDIYHLEKYCQNCGAKMDGKENEE